jgi:Spy/CpxP family protein refolding chaperone
MTHPVQSPLRRRWLASAALVAAFLAGGVTLPMVAASAQDAAQGAAMTMMNGHGGMHAMGMAHVSKMLDQLGATADQKNRVQAILRAGFAPMAQTHRDMAQTHGALQAILTAPTIDRAALEQLRTAEIARLDDSSRIMTKALADAADVLTPEQRARLVKLIAAHPRPS